MSVKHPLGPPEIPPPSATHLAEVVSVDDPDSLGRIQVRLLTYDGVDEQNAPIWARVSVPFAGNNRGAFMIPGIGDEVLVMFINGDSRAPVVVGALWNGANQVPETLSGNDVDKWTIVGTNGTRIAIVEESASENTVSFETPGGVTGTLTDRGGGEIKFEAVGTTITVNSQGMTVDSPAKVTINASQTEVTSGTVTVNAGISTFSGVVKCDVLQTNTVISTVYTPGAGNVW